MQKIEHEVQQLATGEQLVVHEYTFQALVPGPNVYLQANLHGPEVLGTAVLTNLLSRLDMAMRGDMRGKVTVVPCANPMGVQQTAYNSMVGRWNARSGNNWNRIVPIGKWKSRAEGKAFYESLLKEANLSIEKKLAGTLRKISSDADIVVDMHTTGNESIEHLFTFSWMDKVFSPLGAPVHIHLDGEEPSGAFDESHVLPYLKHVVKKDIPFACTWEIGTHGRVPSSLVSERSQALYSWLERLWSGSETNQSPEHKAFSRLRNLQAPYGGYYAWLKEPGATVARGDTYARVYQPWNGSVREAKAEFDFLLLGIYGVDATAAHEQIGCVAVTPTSA